MCSARWSSSRRRSGFGGFIFDVVIETEHDVWTLLVPGEGAVSDISERAADVLDVGGWLAGRRAHHCGVIECPRTGASVARILKTRYGTSASVNALG